MTKLLIPSMLFGAMAVAIAVPILSDYPPIVKKKKLYAANDLRGKKAPEFVVEQWLHQADPNFKDKVLVVDFWATWCGPCRKLIPEMNEWAKKLSKDAVFVGLSDEPAATVEKFMKTFPMNYSVAIDTQKRMSKALGVHGIPHVMVVSPDGIVRWQGFPGSSEDPLTLEKLEQVIAASKASR
jgi:cytochrome c biogenesis protein CcmG, thiol:disulfide interchange protein DsbE